MQKDLAVRSLFKALLNEERPRPCSLMWFICRFSLLNVLLIYNMIIHSQLNASFQTIFITFSLTTWIIWIFYIILYLMCYSFIATNIEVWIMKSLSKIQIIHITKDEIITCCLKWRIQPGMNVHIIMNNSLIDKIYFGLKIKHLLILGFKRFLVDTSKSKIVGKKRYVEKYFTSRKQNRTNIFCVHDKICIGIQLLATHVILHGVALFK